MLCPRCGTDTPYPAVACRTCQTPFPGRAVPADDPATIHLKPASTASRRATTGTGPLAEGAPFGPRYRILRALGAGGMGVVYQAWDDELGVAVALKVIRPEATSDPEGAREVERRFKRELLLARQVTHKNVVRIHDLGEIDGIKYITMPYIEGHDLRDLLFERGALPIAEAVGFARQIAAGLAAAHEVGVVHRDLKPENIMIDSEGQALIMDFGISRSIGTANETATAAGAIMGTLEYMAPEQARGENVDQRADIYAFGLMLHDMLTGERRVSAAQSALSEMMRRMQQAPAAIRSLRADVPEALGRIVDKSLKPNPDERYQQTSELVADLESLDADGNRLPLYKEKRWNPITAALAVAALLSAGTAVWFAQHRSGTAPSARTAVSVLIADFVNRTSDPVFDGALEQSLAIAMEGSPFVSVYPAKEARATAAKLKPESKGRVDAEVGQLIARREGVKVLLAGSIDTAGSGYRLTLQAIDPAKPEKPIETEQRNVADKGAVLSAIATLSEKMRQRLGESKSAMDKVAAAETFTAGSLEAMRAYAAGQQLLAAGKYDEALASFQTALKADPDLGRAYAAMGAIYVNRKQTEQAKEAFDNALKHLNRMSKREELRTLATYYLGVQGNNEKGIDAYEQLIKAFPADDVAYGNLAFAYVRVSKVARAQEVARKGLDLYPNNLVQRTNYAAYSVYAGDFKTAAVEAQRVLRENPKFEYAYLPLALSQIGQGDVDAARATYAKLSASSDAGRSLALFGNADLDASRGAGDAARKALQEGIALDTALGSSGELATKHMVLAEIALASGDNATAVAEARKAIAGSRVVYVVVPAARVLLAAGADAAATDVVADLKARLQTQTSVYAAVLEAEAAVRAGKVAAAIDTLKQALARQDVWLGRLILGRAYLEAGADHATEALDEFKKCFDRRGEALDLFFADSPTTRYLPQVSYYLGRSYEAVGDRDAAAKAYDEFLRMRPDAARDPLVVDARRRLGGLR